jgi:hypothetical protein
VGYQPRAAADEQAWRAAGSPNQWTVPGSGTPLVNAPGKPRLTPVDAGVRYLPDLGGFDLAQLRLLPADPARLRTLFEERIAGQGLPPGSENSGIRLFGTMTQLLVTVPAPGPLRAAALTVLAGLPGVRDAGDVTDAQGRAGTGVELRRSSGGVTESHRLVIDPTTHRILAEDYVAEQDGQPLKEHHVVVLASEWTDQRPVPPAAP